MIEAISADMLDGLIQSVNSCFAVAADAAATAAESVGGAVGETAPLDTTVQIDWIGETIKGGFTALAQIILLIVGIISAVERTMTLREKNFNPPDLIGAVLPLWKQGQYNCILAYCHKFPSTMADMIAYVVENRNSGTDILVAGAQDLAGREMRVQGDKSVLIGFVVAMEPMLGLLGTMIGMIEAFKLVETYGDEGGASMLAGSISKALITTAVGLIVALPFIAVYSFLKNRINKIGAALEEAFDRITNAWLTEPPVPQTDGEYTVADIAAQIHVVKGRLATELDGESAESAESGAETPEQ